MHNRNEARALMWGRLRLWGPSICFVWVVLWLFTVACTSVLAGPLHDAAAQNDAATLRTLIKEGAAVGERNGDGLTALDAALLANATDAVDTLLAESLAVYTTGVLSDPRVDVRDRVRARGTLARLVRAKPDSETVNFAFGLICVATRDFAGGQLAFERVLSVNPLNDRARLELGRACMAAGQFEAARNAFEEVLLHDPPATVRTRIEQHLDAIRRQTERWHLSARADIGWLGDDNVNVGPSSSLIEISPILVNLQELTALEIAEGSEPTTADGTFAAVGVSGAYDVGQAAGWMWTADASWFQNWLNNGHRNEVQFLEALAGIRHVGRESVFDASVKAAHIEYGHDSLVQIYGIEPSYVKVSSMSPRLSWTTSGGCEVRDYDELTSRDGLYVFGEETVRYAFGSGRHALIGGAKLSHDWTAEDIFQRLGLGARLGLELRLLRMLKLYGQVYYEHSFYDEREVLAPEDREDKRTMFTAGTAWTLMEGWGMDVRYRAIDAASTFGIYDYDRHITTISTWLAF